MNKLISTLFALGLAFFVYAEDLNEIKIESSIEDVTVFLTGGEVHRTAEVKLKAGRNKLIFKRISTVADHKSVQFNADKAFNLVSVSSEIDYLSFVDNNPRIKTLKDSVATLKDKNIDLLNEKSAYDAEKKLLQKNNSIKGEQQNLSVEELRSMAEYYRTRMMELNKIITQYDKDIGKNNTIIYRYQQQLTELNYKETVKSNQIIVIVDSDEAKTLNVDLKYIVSNCGWQANYDLSADNIDGAIELKYKAKVYNNSGNDWNDVKMVLSTSDPNISASAPVLYPWYLNYSSLNNQNDFDDAGYVVPQNRAYTQYYQNASTPKISQNLDGVVINDEMNSFEFGVGNGNTNPSNVSFKSIEVSQLSTEFNIKKKYTIPSDSKPYLVEITNHNLNSTFSHKAVPKLDKDAFLLSNIVGWEKLDLVPGPTNVYFADTYVGQSYINTANVEDTLRLSFGRDKKIGVQRKLLEEFSDKKVVGGNRKDSYTYEITIKNNRNIEVNMDLFDQIPISQDSDISVSIEETSEADYNETTGRLRWKVKIKPGETKKYRIGFTIKYPKSKKIKVKKYRTVYSPSF
ncbi:MAG: DUF4139 domain-containing protein [Flavobacteriales bacterium]|nr:DUF4139 domain-containing protein [Flavobacteriales bacterium]